MGILFIRKNPIHDIYDYTDYKDNIASNYILESIEWIHINNLITESINLFNPGTELAIEAIGAIYAGYLPQMKCLWIIQ